MLNLIRSLFIVILLLTPFIFSGATPENFFFLILPGGGALTLFMLYCLKSGHPVYQAPGLPWLVLAAGYMVFRMIPLPLPLLTLLSPETAAVWTETAGLLRDSHNWRLSLDFPDTLNRLTLLLACLGCYWLAVQLLSDRMMLKRLTIILICFGGLLALVSIPQSMLSGETAGWFQADPEIEPVFITPASFFNRHHHAGLMIMLFPVSLALALVFRPARQFGPLRMRVPGFLEEAETPLFIILCLAALLMILSVFVDLLQNGITLPGWEWPSREVMIGRLLAAGFLITILRLSLRKLTIRKEPLAIILCYGAMAGVAAMLGHTFLVSGKPPAPAGALYFFFLCALMIAAAHTRINPHLTTTTYLKTATQRRTIIALSASACVWLCLLVFNIGQAVSPEISAVVPGSIRHYIQQGDAALADGRPEAALDAYDRALWLAPTRSLTLQKIGRALFQAGYDMSEADAFFTAGIAYAPGQADAYHRQAAFLLETNRPETALAQIREGIMTAPDRAEIFFTLMKKNGFSAAAIFDAMPDSSPALLEFFAYVKPLEDDPLRERILRRAVAVAENESSPPRRPFLLLADLYDEQGQNAQVLGVLERGVAARPWDTDLLLRLARAYEKNLIFYKAEHLYRRILALDPEHRPARQRLAEITSGE